MSILLKMPTHNNTTHKPEIIIYSISTVPLGESSPASTYAGEGLPARPRSYGARLRFFARPTSPKRWPPSCRCAGTLRAHPKNLNPLKASNRMVRHCKQLVKLAYFSPEKVSPSRGCVAQLQEKFFPISSKSQKILSHRNAQRLSAFEFWRGMMQDFSRKNSPVCNSFVIITLQCYFLARTILDQSPCYSMHYLFLS